MAKKIKEAPSRDGIASKDLRGVIADINRLKDSASEASGLAGKRTQQACEQYGLEKTALTFVSRLDRMEPAKRQGILREVIHYAYKAGHFAEIDAFDDLIDRLEAIVKEARDGEEKPSKPDETMSGLVN